MSEIWVHAKVVLIAYLYTCTIEKRINFRTAAQRYLKQNFHAENKSVNGKNTIKIKTSLDIRDLLQKKTLNERIVGYYDNDSCVTRNYLCR